ncbi:cell division protein FtsL [Halalkalibacter kiskunsagensis]|uniref:Cell division protein FtsL n=1 Tax=Halalkalibacter kiskunsagensis TaxID=1548599 RepID=A0ABV6KIC5_9BACI
MLARKYQEQEQRQIQTKTRVRRVRNPITVGEKAIAGLITFIAFIVFGVIVHNYATLYTVNQEAYQLQQTINQQAQLNEGLTLQVVELSAPDRILHIAKEELGMTLDDNKVKVVQN